MASECPAPSRPPWSLPPEFDTFEVYGLVAMAKHPAVRGEARRLGPSLFTPGAPQRLAATLVTGELPPCPTAADARLLAEVRRCQLDPDEAWGLHIIKVLAQQQHRELLADQLAWGVHAARSAGVPLKFIAEQIRHALAIALGEIPIGLPSAREVAA